MSVLWRVFCGNCFRWEVPVEWHQKNVFWKGKDLILFHKINWSPKLVENCKSKIYRGQQFFKGKQQKKTPLLWITSQVRLACRRGYRPLGGHTFGRCSLNGAWCSMAGGRGGLRGGWQVDDKRQLATGHLFEGNKSCGLNEWFMASVLKMCFYNTCIYICIYT